MLIYNKLNGSIISNIPDSQDVLVYFRYYPNEFKESLSSLDIKTPPKDLENYKVINGELTRMNNLEIQEIQIYNKILTEEERLLENIKPSPEEVKKAENTIEILTLIQEVM